MIAFAIFINGYMAERVHVIYVISITLRHALAQKYSRSCLGVPNRPTSRYSCEFI